MTITLEPELEQKVQEAAERAGLHIDDYVSAALRQRLEAQSVSARDREGRKERIRLQAQQMAADPLFLQDVEETMEDYKFIDSETARMMDKEHGKEDAA